MSNRRQLPEKSKLMQNCSLLGRYLNGKVSLTDLSLGIGRNHLQEKPELVCPETTTMDFLGKMEKPSHTTQQNMISGQEHDKTAQLTIFYSGKLMVFDDFPADKARAVMLLASKAGPPTAVSGGPPPPPPLQSSNASTDLCMPRRSSLLRFLEKRKDRTFARAPYQLYNNHHAMPSSSKNHHHHPSSSISNNDDEDSSSNNIGNEQLDLTFKL